MEFHFVLMDFLGVYAAAGGSGLCFAPCPERRVAHYRLVSSRMKTDVVFLACHKSPKQPTCEHKQTDLVSGRGIRHRAAHVAGPDPRGSELLWKSSGRPLRFSPRLRPLMHRPTTDSIVCLLAPFFPVPQQGSVEVRGGEIEIYLTSASVSSRGEKKTRGREL